MGGAEQRRRLAPLVSLRRSSAGAGSVQSNATGGGAGVACDTRPARVEPVNSGGRSLVAGSSNMLVCVGPDSPQMLSTFWRGTTRLAS